MPLTKSPRFQKRSAAIAVLALLGALSLPAWAVEPFKLQDIRVEGLQRTEPGTVFSNLPFRVGDVYDDDRGSAAIRALYATGLFSDVRLNVQGDVLVVEVQERPTISGITFSGNKEFNNDILTKALRDIGIAEGRPFDKALSDRAEQEIKRQYLSRSLYGAEVVTTVTPVENNRVNVNFSVVEGDVAKIDEIRIVGNHAFSTSTLLDQFNLTTGGWLTWYTKSNRYSREKLDADLETLRSYYLNRGYLDFRIDSTQVEITPDKQRIAVIVNVTEGQQFTLSSIDLQGDYLGREDEFKALVTAKPGEPYNAAEVADTTKAFSQRFGTFGYAFAQVQAQPVLNREQGTVALNIVSTPQRRAYVRRINITGNDKTRDEVIRREMRQFESAWYDGDKIALSRDRVDRLGFFTGVAVDTTPVAGTDDQVDLTMHVDEKPTGSLTLGAGYSSSDKVSLTAGISQDNVFGSGNNLGFQVNTSKYNRQFLVSTTDPYFTQDGISRTVDLYYRTSTPYTSSSTSEYYSITTPGADIKFGVPFSEVDKVYFGVGIEGTRVKPGQYMPEAYQDFINDYGKKSVVYFPLTIGWGRDSRDSALVPTKGAYQRADLEVSPFGDVKYARAGYQYQHWFPITKDYTFAFNGEIGAGASIGGHAFPVFKNYTGGGLGSVRGFESGSLGLVNHPYDANTDYTGTVYLGGTRKFNLNFEAYAPMPGAGNDRSLRLIAFTDVGNVTSGGFAFQDARASVGVGLSWISPLGPLKFSFAQPVRKKPGDSIQRFQFQIGTAF